MTVLELLATLSILSILSMLVVPVYANVSDASAKRTVETNANAVARNAEAIRAASGSSAEQAVTESITEHNQAANSPFTDPVVDPGSALSANMTLSGRTFQCSWTVGEGPITSSCQPAPDPTTPAAPENLAVEPLRAAARLTWTAPDNGGRPITHYVVEYTDGTGYQTYDDNVNATTITVTGLQNDVLHTFRVTAVNNIGAGPSSSVSTTPAIEWEFVSGVGSTANDYAYTSVTTADGGMLVAGIFRYDVTFGETTLSPFGCPSTGTCADAFVAKLDAAGTWIWAQRAGGQLTESIRTLATTSDGGAYVVGEFQANTNGMHFPNAAGGNITIHNGGGLDLFAAKINSDGFWVWAQRAGTSGTDAAYGAAVTDDGGVAIVGRFSGTNVLFGSSITRTSLNGTSDILVAKLGSSGTWQWVTRAGGTSADDYAHGVDVLDDGDLVVTGVFSGTADFGDQSLTSNGLTDVFVGRLDDSDGTWQWAVNGGSTAADTAWAARRDGARIYVTGAIGGNAAFGATTLTTNGQDAFVAAIDGDGQWQWAVNVGGAGADAAYGIDATSSGGMILVGAFSGTISFGTTTFSSAGGFDLFVAEISPSGSWRWATRAGGTSADVAYGVSIGADDSVMITGYFETTATFGAFTRSSGGMTDVFVGKILP